MIDREEKMVKKIRGLAIEAATKTASVALIEDGKIIAEMTLNGRLNHSETLLPMIDDICRTAKFDVLDLDFIGVSKGPGSYTGLRIGISIAKGIARVAGAVIVGVSTLESLAMNGREGCLVCPMVDARRRHAYCAAYYIEDLERSEGSNAELEDEELTSLSAGFGMVKLEDRVLKPIIKPELRSVEDFTKMVGEVFSKVNQKCESAEDFKQVFAKVEEGLDSDGLSDELFAKVNGESENVAIRKELFAKVHYLGDGTVSHRELLVEYAGGDFILGSDRENTPFASVLAGIAYERFKNGEGVRYSEFTPDYFRSSQAKRMLGSK